MNHCVCVCACKYVVHVRRSVLVCVCVSEGVAILPYLCYPWLLQFLHRFLEVVMSSHPGRKCGQPGDCLALTVMGRPYK